MNNDKQKNPTDIESDKETKNENNEEKTTKNDGELPRKIRKQRIRVEDLPLPDEEKFPIEKLALTLAEQLEEEKFREKYLVAGEVLKLVGAGLFLASTVIMPGLGHLSKALLKDDNEREAWKRFNIPYLKRHLERLEKQKMVEISEKNGKQVVKITQAGKRRILKYALEEIAIKKPGRWNGEWTLVSYDVPRELHGWADFLRHYLIGWGFYPLHKSVFLHAYPCQEPIEFLREYLGIGKYVRMFQVTTIENDQSFREFFGV